MNADDVYLFDDLSEPEQELVRQIMKVMIAPKDEARRKARARSTQARAHLGYVECEFCGEENDCYAKDGKPRCMKCKREHENVADTALRQHGLTTAGSAGPSKTGSAQK